MSRCPANGLRDMQHLIEDLRKNVRAENEREQIVREFGAGIAAPAVLACLLGLERWSAQHGIRRWYPLARDGDVLVAASGVLGWSDKRLPPLTYLHAPRLVLRRALADVSPEKLVSWSDDPSGASTLRARFARIGLAPEDIQPELEDAGLKQAVWDRPVTAHVSRLFSAALARPGIRARLAGNATATRELMLEYFSDRGLTADTNDAAVFDVGWQASCQGNILRFFEITAGRTPRLAGGYFSLKQPLLLPPGARVWSILDPEVAAHARMSRDIIFMQLTELCFSSNHGGVTRFERKAGRVQPVFGPGFDAGERAWGWDAFRSALLEAIMPLAACADACRIEPSDLGALAAAQIRKLQHQPTTVQSRILGTWPACSDSLHQSAGELAPCFSWRGIFGYTFKGRPQPFIWRQASERRLSLTKRLMLRALCAFRLAVVLVRTRMRTRSEAGH